MTPERPEPPSDGPPLVVIAFVFGGFLVGIGLLVFILATGL